MQPLPTRASTTPRAWSPKGYMGAWYMSFFFFSSFFLFLSLLLFSPRRMFDAPVAAGTAAV